jgi:hypothetical protein
MNILCNLAINMELTNDKICGRINCSAQAHQLIIHISAHYCVFCYYTIKGYQLDENYMVVYVLRKLSPVSEETETCWEFP